MMTPSDDERERRALDALAAAAMRDLSADHEADDLDAKDEVCLSEEERSVIDRRGSEILRAVLAGSWRPQSSGLQPPTAQVVESAELAGAFNRASGEGEITPAAREEMDSKRRALEDDGESKRGA